MNFKLKFDPEDFVESKKYIPDLFAKFTFNSDSKAFDVDIQLAFVVSNKVKELIKSDPSTTEVALEKGIYQENFLDFFFQSISSKKIIIKDEYLQNFIKITKELKIEGFKNSIKTVIFSHLCKYISESKIFNSDNEMLSFLQSNIKKLNIKLLKGIPDDLIWDIIANSKSSFEDENEYALYILNFIDTFEFNDETKKDDIIINYIDTIQFKNLNLDVYERILIRIQSIDGKAYLFNNIIERNLFEISKNKVEINLLNITLKGGVDFNFLTRLNLKNDN